MLKYQDSAHHKKKGTPSLLLDQKMNILETSFLSHTTIEIEKSNLHKLRKTKYIKHDSFLSLE